jgi:hypothetical protein
MVSWSGSDGGYLIAGTTSSYGAGESDIYVVKVNSSGGMEWDLTYGGDANDNALHIARTLDGDYIVTGNAYSPTTLNDVLLLKVTEEGSVEWYETYGGDNSDYGRAVDAVSDGG